MTLVASMMASMESMASMVASMSNGDVVGFHGVDGVDGWRRWLRWMASMVVTGVFDTEGTDGSPYVSPVVRLTRTEVACFQSEQFAGEQRICPCAVLSSLSVCVSCLTVCQLPGVSFHSSVQLGHDSVYCDSYSHSCAVLPLT